MVDDKKVEFDRFLIVVMWACEKKFESGNKVFLEICEINNIEYLQKLICTERNEKLCNNIYTHRFSTPSSI